MSYLTKITKLNEKELKMMAWDLLDMDGWENDHCDYFVKKFINKENYKEHKTFTVFVSLNYNDYVNVFDGDERINILSEDGITNECFDKIVCCTEQIRPFNWCEQFKLVMEVIGKQDKSSYKTLKKIFSIFSQLLAD